MKESILLKFALLLAVLIPALVVYAFQRRISFYHTLTDKYECNRSMCEADFDGDGTLGTLSRERVAPAPDFDSWLVVVDSGKELLREPYRSQDNTERTHAAIVTDSGLARLIIYDHLFDFKPPRSLVFVYDGKNMVKVSPTKKDQEILAAMGAHDVTGSSEPWVLFRLFAMPALVLYYIVLALVSWRIFFKRR